MVTTDYPEPGPDCQRMGGTPQAGAPMRTPGWVLWTVGEFSNNAGDPEPTTMIRMYTSIWIWISACDRSDSMVVKDCDKTLIADPQAQRR